MTDQRTSSSNQHKADTIPQAILRRQGRSRDRRENLSRSEEINRGWDKVVGKVAVGSAGLVLAASIAGEVLDDSHDQSVKQALDNQKAHAKVVEHTKHELAKDGIVLPSITLSDGTIATATVPSEMSPTEYPPATPSTTVADTVAGETGETSGTGGIPVPNGGDVPTNTGAISPTEG